MERLHYILLTPFVLTLLISPHKTFAEEDKCEGLYPVFSPSSLVVRYGDPVSATCSVPNTTKTSMQYSGMGLEAKQGATDGLQENVMNLTWSVSSLTEWEEMQGIRCYSQFEEQCITNLSVTIYKPPDSVFLRSVSGSGPVVEGNQYQLECEIQSVAPVQKLTVKWFRGKTLLHESTVSQFSVTGRIHKDVTVTDRYNITASREDRGVQYKCEAELKLDLPESLKYQSEPIDLPYCKVGDNCTVEEIVDVADLPIFAGGAASAILVLMVALGVVLCVHYRKTRMGHYMMKNILPNRINRHITHSKENEHSQL